MSEEARPTQKRIAELAEVTQATVSMALKNHPSIPKETCEKIQRIAKEIGYVQDPYLSGLAAYRKRSSPVSYQATLAWITNFPPHIDWKNYHAILGFYEGARQRASELGYGLEEHSLCSEGMTHKRMAQILQAKGIRGLVLAPQPEPFTVLEDFPFDKFAAVTLGYSLLKPRLHLVILNQFRSVEILFQNLIELGYKRPGLAIAVNSDERADRNWSAGFWSEQRMLPEKDRVPMLLADPFNPEEVIDWYHEHKPDVVLGMGRYVVKNFTDAGIRVPEDVGVCLLSVPDDGKYFSGIQENFDVIGAKAVESVIDLIHRGESGVPDVPLYHLVPGRWAPGKTVCRQT